ncbi:MULTISPECIES: hydroxymethylglutaryl-CoA lyase [Shouchella]|uniref:Pyruvate carboxyltransferase n=3 Tax=Bacillaceae TaxID=186817 RepID=A0A060M0N5_9BACI|nr:MULTISPECIES: hydroxymethylglutaryl-CoA lyase [Bacillaceae]RQW21871.1 hydroxymethylglutaryl-CoA lyase [Bacillus sp. C1-1]AIC93634.1 pyruvate carboxyltransferase [Shouchella lehensis G1]KQL56421.1 hydroxymethylglutaryl-CoA lyase [Alkalicoccobacillus plakortidis]MBG9782670.1 hydroxymethylglutaryl-CoA lyase [Shouchella lehensis]TES47713.1 hydroxymethylglutaryl-CoA lyase [Shouchella lehensis]
MIEIFEVGVRDGLQNEKTLLTTEQKIGMLEHLVDSGLDKLEAVSFVHPKLVPAMADAEAILDQWNRPSRIQVAGLALNSRGIDRAMMTSITHLHTSIAVSDAFNLKNAKRSVQEGLEDLLPRIKEAQQLKPVTAILATSFGCPFTGMIPLSPLLKMVEHFLTAGASKIVLGDTTGMANPSMVKKRVASLYDEFGSELNLGLHFHNTRGLALANTLAGYEAGVRHFDASVGGLGGCPYAPLAVGNVCTEDMVHMFHEMGVETGVDLDRLIQTAQMIQNWFPKPLPGMVMKAGKTSTLAEQR